MVSGPDTNRPLARRLDGQAELLGRHGRPAADPVRACGCRGALDAAAATEASGLGAALAPEAASRGGGGRATQRCPNCGTPRGHGRSAHDLLIRGARGVCAGASHPRALL